MRLAPYFAYFKKSFLGRSAYRFDHLMSILSTCLRIFIFWEIYRALYGTRQEVDGITMAMVTTNFILSMGLDAIFYMNDYFLPNKIQDGSIATELLRPMSFKGRMFAENMGCAVFNLIFHFTPSFFIALALIGIMPQASKMSLLCFVLSAMLGYGVMWSISFTLQMLSFWLINMWSLMTLKTVLINVFSGTMIPLWFMPDWMEKLMRFTPFSSIYFTPVQIYLGQLSGREIMEKCLVQLVWILIIFFIGDFLWKCGQRKLVVQGG